MLALRSLTRSAPRTLSHAGLRSAFRQAPAAARLPLLSLNRNAGLARTWAAPFSAAARLRQDDQSLVVKLQDEIQVETDIKDPDGSSEAIQEYLKRSPFELQDTPGDEEVVLTRTFGNENIRITFSVADIANQEFSTEDDEAFADEAYESGSSSSGQAINQSSSSSSRGTPSLAPEDRVAQSDESASHDDAEAGPESFPARLNIIVTKDGKKGALMLEAIAEDGHISIDNMFFFADKDLAEPKSFESDWKRRGVYAGPPFGNLDDELQALMDNYLGERGINDELALFIPDYIDYKEQKEYLRWLSNLKEFHE